ncbi:MAG: hypothetical protein R3C15_09365 [Thermoleophilia bacterium]
MTLTDAIVADDVEACFAAGWTDGLPVVPPTRERVERMLGAWADRRGEVVCVLAPQGGHATLEKVAANAVMAGCLPEHLPIVVAALKAASEPRFSLYDILTTVHSMCPLLLVGGPLAREVGMNGGVNALGHGNRANATIGRALNLCFLNIGNARPGGLDPTTIGHPGHYAYCYTENVDESPWPELHVERGLAADDSAVTVYAADAPVCVAEMGTPTPEHVLRTVAECAAIPGTYNTFFRGELWLVMSPEHANVIASAGWSRADAQAFLFEHARLRADRLWDRGLYAFADQVLRPAWLDEAEPGDLIPIVESPERITITVAGGPYGGYTSIVFGEINGSVTRRIER